jgi:hypothetical protein
VTNRRGLIEENKLIVLDGPDIQGFNGAEQARWPRQHLVKPAKSEMSMAKSNNGDLKVES